jgi:hypothetical protein
MKQLYVRCDRCKNYGEAEHLHSRAYGCGTMQHVYPDCKINNPSGWGIVAVIGVDILLCATCLEKVRASLNSALGDT